MQLGQRGQGFMPFAQTPGNRNKRSKLVTGCLIVFTGLGLAGLSILHAQQVWQDDLGGRAVVSTRPYREILEQDPDALRLPRVQGQYAGSLDRDSTLQSTKGSVEWSEDAGNFASKHKNRQQDEFRPGQAWLDDQGKLIQAHGGGVIYHEGFYYWYGENKAGPTYTAYSVAYSPPRVDVIGVNCYSSADLLHWKDEGLALTAGTHPDLDPQNVLERPKVLYHAKRRQFVMWMHVDTADYELARVGVAVSDSPTGPFRYLSSLRPHNQQARDMTVFQDEDGSAYMAYSSEDNAVMHVAALMPDYLGIQSAYRRILVRKKREAPALFKFRRYYLLLTSGCTGWEPNRAEIFYATSMMGEWTSLGNPSGGGTELDRAYTFFAQVTHVVAVHGKPGKYIFMADSWDPQNLGASRYVWLPMWVEEVPAEEHEIEMADYRRAKAQHQLQNGSNSAFRRPPGPARVSVRWYDSWQLSILDKELDPQLRDLSVNDMPVRSGREDANTMVVVEPLATSVSSRR